MALIKGGGGGQKVNVIVKLRYAKVVLNCPHLRMSNPSDASSVFHINFSYIDYTARVFYSFFVSLKHLTCDNISDSIVN